MTAEQHEALARLSEILEEAKALAEEAREIINAGESEALSK